MDSRRLYLKSAAGLLQLVVGFGALLFLPAGTFAYPAAWAFIGMFFLCSLAITLYLAATDRRLLEQRLAVGPAAEQRPQQKAIMTLAMATFAATLVVPALDRRFGWSDMQTWVIVAGHALIVTGFLIVARVFHENSYGASTIRVADDQRVISTGPYAVVRHPMYAGALVLVLGMPLALGSWWGLLLLVPTLIGLAWRLTDEERFLMERLEGYADYRQAVRYRLIPRLW